MTTRKIARNTKRRPAKTPSETVKVPRSELERWDGLLARAQKSAINAAPRPLPHVGQGVEAAIGAYDTIGYVRDSIAKATERGAS